jgi:hypothetical protein
MEKNENAIAALTFEIPTLAGGSSAFPHEFAK